MDIMWLSDSPNSVRQGQFLVVWQSQLGMTSMWFTQWAYSYTWWQLQWIYCKLETNRSCISTRPGILALTYKALNFSLCNLKLSDGGGSGPDRPSGMRWEWTWITVSKEMHSDSDCTSYTQIPGAITIDNLLASEQVIWTFIQRVADCKGRLGVTMKHITQGDGDSLQVLGGRAESSGISGKKEAPKGICEKQLSACQDYKGGTGWPGWAILRYTVLFLASWIFLLNPASLLWLEK